MLYDPAASTWTAAGSLAVARQSHTATPLANGDVLVAGGFGISWLATAELYSAATGSWSSAGSMHRARFNHTATLLSSGKVLVAGGSPNPANLPFTSSLTDAAELYTSSPTNTPPAVTANQPGVTVDEGSPVSNSGTVSDAEGNTLYTLLPKRWLPYLTGSCRPVLMEDPLRQAGFSDVQRQYLVQLMPSEIVVARVP